MILLVFCFIPTHLLKKEFPPVQFKIWTPLHFNFAFDVFFVLFLLTKLALVASHMLLSNFFVLQMLPPSHVGLGKHFFSARNIKNIIFAQKDKLLLFVYQTLKSPYLKNYHQPCFFVKTLFCKRSMQEQVHQN